MPQTTAFDTPENGEYFKDTHIFELLTKNITLIHDFQGKVEYLLHEFGTSQHCNRFDVGNSIESLIIDILKKKHDIETLNLELLFCLQPYLS